MSTKHCAYGWQTSGPAYSNCYLLPVVNDFLWTTFGEERLSLVDLGCGNGYVSSQLAELGHEVTGIDVSADGIDLARAAYPGVRFELASVYEGSCQGLFRVRSIAWYRSKS